MKKIKKQNSATVALFAGATALMTLTPQIHAQSSEDALLNKLEQKGILTPSEADELKAENATNSVDDFNKAFDAKFPAPDWVTAYKFSGDFRGRFDDQTGNDALTSRIRIRYRLRVGLDVSMKDNLQVGFSLGSDDSNPAGNGGTPTSNNSTFANNGSKKFIYVNTAYAKWTPINDDTWMLDAVFGKMWQPFDVSWMVFDPDYTPEGGALQGTYKFNDNQSVHFNGGAFVLDELGGSSRDPFMYGGQMIWNAKWTPHIASALSLSAFDIVNLQSLKHNYDGNSGNTAIGGVFPAVGGYASNFNPIDVDGSVTYTLDSIPLYNGKFPISVFGEYMNNPGASHANEGWNAGITFGKAGKKGNWDVSYRYQRLDADAWWDQVENDDNLAFLPGAGVVSGTNVKGHLIMFDYSIFDSLTFTFTCYVNSLINNPSSSSSDAIHAMADLMWKF